MNSGLYAACAALIARTGSLEIAANNLANVSTAGYKNQQTVFRSVLAQKTAPTGELNRAVNDFAVLGGSRADLAQGNLDRTGGDFDCAIDGSGFFTIQTKAGIRYTRDGRFQLSSNGELVNSQGDRVLGAQGPIRLPKGTLSISDDGTLSVDGALAGKLRIVEFAPGTALTAEGNTYYSADAAAATPATNSMVKQGTVEASNVNPVSAAVDLITLQRHSELLERVLAMFHSDLNRVAAEELPRM